MMRANTLLVFGSYVVLLLSGCVAEGDDAPYEGVACGRVTSLTIEATFVLLRLSPYNQTTGKQENATSIRFTREDGDHELVGNLSRAHESNAIVGVEWAQALDTIEGIDFAVRRLVRVSAGTCFASLRGADSP